MSEGDFEGDSTDESGLGLWVPVSELAEMRGLARQVMYRKVDRLVEQGLIETKTGPRGVRLVSPAEYDRALGQFGDMAREQGAETRRAAAEDSNSGAYTREQARNMAYRADLSQLELEERRGNLVAVATLRPIIAASAAAAVAVIERLPQEADELRVICARDEGSDLERALKAIAHRMRAEIAAAIEAAMPTAPASQGNGTTGAV